MEPEKATPLGRRAAEALLADAQGESWWAKTRSEQSEAELQHLIESDNT
jgi:hypothetical protein